MGRLKVMVLAAALALTALLGTTAVSAAARDRDGAYAEALKTLRDGAEVYYSGQMDMDGDGQPELIAVYSDGIIRAYEGGAFSSRYVTQVFLYDEGSGRAVSAGRIPGLFYDGSPEEGIELLAWVSSGGSRLIVNGGQNMNYRYSFYGIRDGRLVLVRKLCCDWEKDLCTVNGRETCRPQFMEELRSWQQGLHRVRYFDGTLSADKRSA